VLETEAGSTSAFHANKKISYPQPAVAVVLAECVNAKYYLVVKYYRLKHLIFQEKNSKTTGD
jgi:hypothetical protein